VREVLNMRRMASAEPRPHHPHLSIGECGGGVARMKVARKVTIDFKGADSMATNSKANTARRTKATKPTKPPKTIEIAMPESATAEEAKEKLAKSIPGWDELTKDQQTELTEMAVAQCKKRQPVKVTLTSQPGGGISIGFAAGTEVHGLLKLQKAFAAVSIDPVNARANELLKYLGSVGADNADRYNAALSFIESMDPQNQAEALLLVQMYVTHDAAIRALTRIGSAEWVPTVQMFGNLATKLLRTSQGQMETLARMRRGGEQVVRHVHVDNRGGQAVIAENVHTGGKRNGKIDDQSHAAGAAGLGPALLGADPFGNGVPISSCERPKAVPNARGHESGCVTGE
jgi:hypothetical protein